MCLHLNFSCSLVIPAIKVGHALLNKSKVFGQGPFTIGQLLGAERKYFFGFPICLVLGCKQVFLYFISVLTNKEKVEKIPFESVPSSPYLSRQVRQTSATIGLFGESCSSYPHQITVGAKSPFYVALS